MKTEFSLLVTDDNDVYMLYPCSETADGTYERARDGDPLYEADRKNFAIENGIIFAEEYNMTVDGDLMKTFTDRVYFDSEEAMDKFQLKYL